MSSRKRLHGAWSVELAARGKGAECNQSNSSQAPAANAQPVNSTFIESPTPSTREHKPRERDPLLEQDARDCIPGTGKWLRRSGFTLVTTPLKCDRCNHARGHHEDEKRPAVQRGHDKTDVCDEENRYGEDV